MNMKNLKPDESTIRRISEILDREREINRLTGRAFNIFDIAGIEYDEVRICLVLFNLLDPKGSHCQGTFFLKKFCVTALGIDVNSSLDRAIVKKETSSKDRRMDITIKTPERFIPIEVKIGAPDQDRQCYDYYHDSLRNSLGEENAVVFYLTPDGHEPSKSSSNGLSVSEKDGSGKIRCISFDNEISDFLTECILSEEIASVSPIREILIQFLSSVRKISGSENSDELLRKLRSAIPKEINLKGIGKETKKYFLRETMNRFGKTLNENDRGIIDEIEQYHNWQYRLSNDIGKTSKGEAVSVSLNVDVHQDNAYWGMTLRSGNKLDDDKLMNNDPEVRKIIDKKIGKDYGRINTWIFKEERLKIFSTDKIGFFMLLVPEELEKLIDEAVSDLETYFKEYCNIDQVN